MGYPFRWLCLGTSSHVYTDLPLSTDLLPAFSSTFRVYQFVLSDLWRDDLYCEKQGYRGSHGALRLACYVLIHGDHAVKSIYHGLEYRRSGRERMGGQEDISGYQHQYERRLACVPVLFNSFTTPCSEVLQYFHMYTECCQWTYDSIATLLTAFKRFTYISNTKVHIS